MSEGICREEKKIMVFSYFSQNNSAYACVGLVCSSNRALSLTLINFLLNVLILYFPFVIFQGRETTTWLTSECSQRRQTHWGMKIGFLCIWCIVYIGTSIRIFPAFATLAHKYFLSLSYLLFSNQFGLLWNFRMKWIFPCLYSKAVLCYAVLSSVIFWLDALFEGIQNCSAQLANNGTLIPEC